MREFQEMQEKKKKMEEEKRKKVIKSSNLVINLITVKEKFSFYKYL